MSLTRRIWPAAAFQFFFVAAVALLKPAANALVLSRYHAGALPWLYLGAAAVTAGLAAARAAGTGLRSIAPLSFAIFGAIVTGALALGLWLQLTQVSLIAYVFAEAYATSVALSFWATMGDAFDARESRRVFPWISGLGMSGAIAGGVIAQIAAKLSGAFAQLVGAGVLLALSGVAILWHKSTLETRRAVTVAHTRGATRGYVRTHAYPKQLGLVVLGFSVLSVLADYVFRQRAGALMKEAELAQLFASAQTWTGVICVVFQLFLAERLLRRLGILKYLALVPAMLGVLAVVSAVLPSVWSAWSLKLFEGAASLSLLPVGFQLLYAPLPDDVRDGVRSGIDGFLRKGGLAVGGLLLVVTGAWAPPSVLPFGVVLLCGVTAVLLLRLRPLYLEALHARVAGAKNAVELDELMLGEALKSQSPDRVLRAVDLLEHAGLSLAPHVPGLLAHPHERVQERAVQILEQLSVTTAGPQLEELIAAGMRRPRAEAMWALARLHPDRARVALPPLLGSTDVGDKCAAIGAMLSLGAEEVAPAAAALEELIAHGASAPVVERREVARLLGRIKDEARAPALAKYLEDGDATVRRVAIAAVGAGGYQVLAPRLLRFLTWREDRRPAREALSLLKDDAVPLVAHALDDRSRSLQLRFQLPRVLRQIGTPAAFDALLFSNAADDAFLHYRVGVALSRLRDEHPEHPVDARRVHQALERRRQTGRAMSDAYVNLKAALGAGSLVTRAVGDRVDQAFELSFWLLGLLHDAKAMRRAHAHLSGNDPRRKAWANELLEEVLTPQERALIQEQLDARDRKPTVKGDSQWLEPHLQAMCKSDDSVLRACARYLARRRGWWPDKFKEDDMPEVTIKRLFALEGVEIFAQSDVDDLAAVAAVAKEQAFKKGDFVYQVGDPGDALYVILEGAVEARREGELLLKIGAKEAFGDLSLFDGAPRTTDILATEPLTLLVIDRRDFLDLLGDRPELLRGVFKVMSRQMNSMVMDLTQARRATTGEMPKIVG